MEEEGFPLDLLTVPADEVIDSPLLIVTGIQMSPGMKKDFNPMTLVVVIIIISLCSKIAEPSNLFPSPDPRTVKVTVFLLLMITHSNPNHRKRKL